MDRIDGFPPIVSSQARVLVLGSVPSVASLESDQYYGKPQNAFWRIMGELFGAGPELAYPDRVMQLVQCEVAVWDVLASCIRPGSLDSSIDMKSVQVNDFAALFDDYSRIRHVFFNGKKAEHIFMQRVQPGLREKHVQLSFYSLPSTSPAMAALSFTEKLARWSQVKQVLVADS